MYSSRNNTIITTTSNTNPAQYDWSTTAAYAAAASYNFNNSNVNNNSCYQYGSSSYGTNHQQPTNNYQANSARLNMTAASSFSANMNSRNRNSLSPGSNYSYSDSFSSFSSASPSTPMNNSNEIENGASGFLYKNQGLLNVRCPIQSTAHQQQSEYGSGIHHQNQHHHHRSVYNSSPISTFSNQSSSSNYYYNNHQQLNNNTNISQFNNPYSTSSSTAASTNHQLQYTKQFHENFSREETTIKQAQSSMTIKPNVAKDFDKVILPLLNAADFTDYNSNDANKRRGRTSFSIEQRRYLLSIFEKSPYPSKEILEIVAKELHVTTSIVQTWFKNTRSKQKKLTNTKNLH